MYNSKLKGGVFERIASLNQTATKTEKIFIKSLSKLDPRAIIYMSVTELAEQTNVSEPTIVRFCKKLDFKGFQDFKLNLSGDIMDDKQNGKTHDFASLIADDMKDSIGRTNQEVDYEYIRNIASLIISAKRVYIAAVGNSAIAAMAMKLKLLKAGMVVDTSSDPHVQSLTVANLNKKDLLILVSVSGATKDILDTAENAKKNDVTTVAITNHLKSPLVRYADYVLYNCKKEAPYSGGSLATVVTQLYIADVLSAAIYDLLGDAAKESSTRATEAVSDKLI